MGNTVNTKSYYEQYRDYFEFSDWGDNYKYYIELINIGDNRVWPLVECPNCSCDLETNKPLKKYFKFASRTLLIVATLIGLFIVSYIAARLLILISLVSDEVFYLGLFFYLIFTVAFIYASFNANKIQLFYCPDCNSLLYNKVIEHPITTKMHPNVFFKELEKLGEFRFKA